MSDYRRYYIPGGTYFFTVVTYQRRPILVDPFARECLRIAITEIQAKSPFQIVSIVLLPDHLHCVWTLPSGDSQYSMRWKRIKELFTRRYLGGGGKEVTPSSSRERKGERGIWQRRFWEHTCDDEDDVVQCCDYIHWNPRKHNLVSRVADWPYSSFHRFVGLGEYSIDWGGVDPCPGFDTPEWE